VAHLASAIGDIYVAQTFQGIDASLAQWIARQHVFFVATAPGGRDGLINCSPKGLDSLRVLDERTVAYLDLTGSGAETIAHLKDNGRIVIMLCAFDGPPRIVRLQGRGSVIGPDDTGYAEHLAQFPPRPGTRAVIRVDLVRVSDSCGYAVPLMEFRGDREALTKWAEKKGPDGIIEYQREHNAASLDGLPAVDWLKT
jgi:Pyridoxamine 5'-phosphate oxidase